MSRGVRRLRALPFPEEPPVLWRQVLRGILGEASRLVPSAASTVGGLGTIRLLGLLAVGRGLANRLHPIRREDLANQEGARKKMVNRLTDSYFRFYRQTE